MIKIGINGFGRIGRCIFRALVESGRDDIIINAINVGSGSLENHYHLLKYDSTHGVFDEFCPVEDGIKYDKGTAKVISNMSLSGIDWRALNVDIVLECTGVFATKEKAFGHLVSGAKKVIVSAPCSDADATIVLGVNESIITPDKLVLSIGSCTTNCLAPLVSIIHKNIGIESGFMTTIHAYTNDQSVLDVIHNDKRRARACGVSIIPSATGAAKALGLVIPEMAGKLDGVAVRVPTTNVSMIDFKFKLSKPASVEDINNMIRNASLGSSIIRYCEEELVSIDFNHDSHSAIFDATQTKVVSGDFCRIAAWYDNEWGFANRMLDVAAIIGAL